MEPVAMLAEAFCQVCQLCLLPSPPLPRLPAMAVTPGASAVAASSASGALAFASAAPTQTASTAPGELPVAHTLQSLTALVKELAVQVSELEADKKWAAVRPETKRRLSQRLPRMRLVWKRNGRTTIAVQHIPHACLYCEVRCGPARLSCGVRCACLAAYGVLVLRGMARL